MRIMLLAAAAAFLVGCGGAGEEGGLPTNALAENSASGATEPRAAPTNAADPLNQTAAPQVPQPAAPQASACRIQDGKEISANRLRALGTEPFWAVRIDGRCLTYLTPENQQGTRIWAKFSGSGDSGEWTGFLGKDRFVLRTRPEPGCSDGMSDRRYPLAATLTIGSEQQTGCAEPT